MRKTFGFDSSGNKIYANCYVTAFGTVGDGVADDTAAIQAALDSVKTTGGTIIFPTGVYKLTASVYFYSNQRLIFEGGATLMQGASINNLMMNYSTADKGGYDATENVEIVGATFDGGSYTTNNTLFGVCHSKNIVLRDCRFVNAYGVWHNVEINSSKHVLIDHCYFEGSRKTGQNGCMIQIDSYNNTATWPWNNGAVDSTVSDGVEVRGCVFESNTISPAIGNHSTAIVQRIRVHECVFDGLSSARGAIAFQSASNVDIYNNTFVDCTTGATIGTADGANTLHDNRFIGITAISGGGMNAYNNMVNGAFSS